MNRINRLKYTGVIAGVGLAVVVLSNGAYANTGAKETGEEPETGIESEIEVYSLDLSENTSTYDADDHGIQPLSLDEEGQSEPENDVVLSAGVGDVLTDGENGTEPFGTDDPAEPDTADDQDEIGLSAGAGAVFEQADEEDSAVQARNIETPEKCLSRRHTGATPISVSPMWTTI